MIINVDNVVRDWNEDCTLTIRDNKYRLIKPGSDTNISDEQGKELVERLGKL